MKVLIGIACLSMDNNPYLDRLKASLDKYPPGVSCDIRIEQGEEFERGEKRQRIFAYAKLLNFQWVCILEDDTEILENNWLGSLIFACDLVYSCVGMANPLEARYGSDAPTRPDMVRKVELVPNAFGFCIIYNMNLPFMYDPRISYLDDLMMSLQCRSWGYNIARVGSTTIRHTKQPWASDDTPPWKQTDRSRWGEGDRYYDAERFNAKRLREAEILVQQYGDMALKTLPPELVEQLPKELKI